MEAIITFAMDEGSALPHGTHGGRLHVRYRLLQAGRPVPNATITESFTTLEDPYSVGSSIRQGSFSTDLHGNFDDYVAFASRAALPDDFRLVCDQELLANGARVALNRVVWSATTVSVYARDGRRPPAVSAAARLR